MTKETDKKKKIPWNSIKAEYILGGKPKAIAEKYGITSKQIRDKAAKEKWKTKKTAIDDKIDIAIGEAILNAELARNEKILKINDLAINAYNEYFENKDYKRCLVETTEPYKDANGDIVYDPKGKPIMIKVVKIVEVPFVVAPMLKQATDGLAKANETSRKNEGLDKDGQDEGEAPKIIHSDNLDDSRI